MANPPKWVRARLRRKNKNVRSPFRPVVSFLKPWHFGSESREGGLQLWHSKQTTRAGQQEGQNDKEPRSTKWATGNPAAGSSSSKWRHHNSTLDRHWKFGERTFPHNNQTLNYETGQDKVGRDTSADSDSHERGDLSCRTYNHPAYNGHIWTSSEKIYEA